MLALSALVQVSASLSVAASPWRAVANSDAASAPLLVPARAAGVALIMVEDRGCMYCIKWNKEVGKGYGRTAEGRTAPLRRVGRDARVLDGFAPVIYTPTFILVREGREVGRITGYPGQFYFWEELSQMMSAAGMARGG